MNKSGQKALRENPFERIDVRVELDKLDQDLEALRLQYEQYFTGLLPLAPDKLQADVKRKFRKLLKAPFRNSEANYRLKALESRYSTLYSYWQRVLRQREDGTYSKDVFKANLRERMSVEDERAKTAGGAVERAMQSLFHTYKDAVERQTGASKNLDFSAFKKAVIRQTEDFKSKNQGKKVSFKVVIKNGKVSLEAKVKAS